MLQRRAGKFVYHSGSSSVVPMFKLLHAVLDLRTDSSRGGPFLFFSDYFKSF